MPETPAIKPPPACRPILFASPLVARIRSGDKQGTRRPIRPQSSRYRDEPNPLGRPGDLLYVRETWASSKSLDHRKPSRLPVGSPIFFFDGQDGWLPVDRSGSARLAERVGKKRPSIFLPRWASRVILEITHSHIERLQQITVAEAELEGFRWVGQHSPVDGFRDLWDQLYAAQGLGWETNPAVHATRFRVVISGRLPEVSRA